MVPEMILEKDGLCIVKNDYTILALMKVKDTDDFTFMQRKSNMPFVKKTIG